MFRSGLGHNFELILDCKTRWNSLADMIMIIVKLQNIIEEALLELNCSYMLNDFDFNELKDLQNALEPAKLAVEGLSRNNTTLHSADITLEYMKKKSHSKSEIACENMEKRINE
jgi:6-pyruvoyl-tetrahydropterin synthase